jgi:hypothetical protein
VFDLHWSWLCVPYLVCAAALTAIGVVAAMIQGDRVMRLGVIGTATTALPWTIATAVACWTTASSSSAWARSAWSGPTS